MSLTVDLRDGHEISDYWRLCEEFTLKQAALLIIGCDPASEFSYCEEWKVHERPTGYEATKQGLSAGLRRSLIKGEHCGLPETDFNGNEIGEDPGTTDPERSTVERGSLVEWLRSRGMNKGFFFPAAAHTTGPDYLDPNHARYVAPMAAAVRAWLAMEDGNLLLKKTPKAAMTVWIESRYKELGLLHENDNLKNGTKAGDINKSAVDRAASFANWLPGGGATKTPGG